MIKKKNNWKNIAIAILLLLFFALYLSPLLITLSGSFRTPQNTSSYLNLFTEFSLDSYKIAFERMSYFRSLLNSVVNTSVSVTILVIITSMAGYAISRLKNKAGSFFQVFFLSGMIVSAQMSIIPIYKILGVLGLSNSRVAPIIMYIAAAIAFSIFLFTNFIKSGVPITLEEAALVDGAGPFYTFFTIVLPMIKPAVVAVVITQGVPIWNDFFFSMLFLSAPKSKTLPLMMLNFIGDMENSTQWNILFAACFLSSIPLLLCYAFLQKQFIGGITVGAVKE